MRDYDPANSTRVIEPRPPAATEPVRVERVVLREIRLPLRQAFRISTGVEIDRRIILLELIDADGVAGWSECVGMETPNYLPDTVDTAWFALNEWFIPRLLGKVFGHPREVEPIIGQDVRGHSMAKAALEMGVWVLAAEKARIPLARLLGGQRDRIPVGVSIGIQDDVAALRKRVRVCADEGYRRIKMKIMPGRDVDYLAAARDELGSNVLLMADANSAYSLDDLDTFHRIDELNLLMIEQPLDWDDLVLHAELQRQISTPICLDESIQRPAHVRAMHRLGAGRIVNLKPGRVGGFAPALEIHDFCVSRGIPLWCGGMLESGIGRACNVALASLPGFVLPGDISPSRRYWSQDIVSPEWAMSDSGFISVGSRPGLGVEVDVDHIERLTIREAVHSC